MEVASLFEQVLGQGILGGILFFFLWKIWDAYLKEKDKKDAMAEALIKLTQSWEDRYSKETTDEREIKAFMVEIRDFVKEIRDAK
jgi:hypothetical protein